MSVRLSKLAAEQIEALPFDYDYHEYISMICGNLIAAVDDDIIELTLSPFKNNEWGVTYTINVNGESQTRFVAIGLEWVSNPDLMIKNVLANISTVKGLVMEKSKKTGCRKKRISLEALFNIDFSRSRKELKTSEIHDRAQSMIEAMYPLEEKIRSSLANPGGAHDYLGEYTKLFPFTVNNVKNELQRLQS